LTFRTGSFQDIKSISQRNLALYWNRLQEDLGLPSIDHFHPGSRVHEPKQLVVWAIEDDQEPRRFRALRQGEFVAEASGERWEGKTMDEVTPPNLLPLFSSASNECADRACAIYTILRTQNAQGHVIDLERLLLPFGRQGKVERIVASLQLISPECQPERRSVKKDFEFKVAETLKVRIFPWAKMQAQQGSPCKDGSRVD
jgi:hypothetical protein